MKQRIGGLAPPGVSASSSTSAMMKSQIGTEAMDFTAATGGGHVNAILPTQAGAFSRANMIC